MVERHDRARLEERLRARIRERGPVPFVEFMESALYDEEDGFYARPPVGPDREFVTSPHVSPVFGMLLARLLDELWTALGEPDPFHVVEAGAGDGTLAAQLLAFLPERVRAAARYVAVERSRGALDALRRLEGVEAVPALEAAPTAVEGCVLANELLDNLPFHWIRRDGDGAHEVHVGLAGEGFVPVPGPLTRPELEVPASALEPGGERVVQLGALAFLDAAAARLRRGYVLVVDYGFVGTPPSSPHAYRGHRPLADVLSEPGSRDITAGVDMLALADHARRQGLRVWGPVRQRDALLALGYQEVLEDARRLQVAAAASGRGVEATRIYSRRNRAGLLVHPAGLGDFLVLAVGVGVDAEPSVTRALG